MLLALGYIDLQNDEGSCVKITLLSGLKWTLLKLDYLTCVKRD